MRRLGKPPYTALSSFNTCVDGIRDKTRADRLKTVTPLIEQAETNYLQKGDASQLYTIPEMASVGSVDCAEMERLYTGIFSRKGSLARLIYDKIKLAPRNNMCPLCAQRVVSTLDHYLAKSRHPALAVTPVNLVPSCADCNKAKLDSQPTSASEQTLHPYFDDVEESTWLIAKLLATVPPTLLFEASPPVHWPDLKRKRVLTHFKTFGLDALYASHGAEELTNIRHHLEMIMTRGGVQDVRSYLREQMDTHQQVARNSWKVAMYKALSESEWFCDGGFKMIPR